ncbi:hydrogenase maturation protease [Cryobacterium melibiosiphilum]|uniref:Hydrogenase maturation protease n=1 Tax=Cryobacterium melibiosiphilum TaxID=995039 RepID=A0A3A5MKG3_9MICO|nr:hydrogenase maturation protease [Cryobacterium melibiosiphilum]RJT88669.1 hydrogenase maturation protease [Cryobacterium melibiosiphilum]RJT89431.1 hydrogenase maturation protease [Cryobacterium melibiosiphilum]
MAARVLVAGVGNIFLRDDGFGPEVARQLMTDAAASRPGVRVVDYGIRGMHLVYDLLDGVDRLVLVDALPARGARAAAGDIRVLQIRPEDVAGRSGRGVNAPDAHSMDPLAALDGLHALGGTLPLTYLVGCVAGDTEEGMGLSDEVAASVPEALAAVRALLAADLTGFTTQESGGE